MARLGYLQIHPRTGVFYFRKRLPKSAIAAFGRKELLFSLKTKDRRQAEKLAAGHLNTLYGSLGMLEPLYLLKSLQANADKLRMVPIRGRVLQADVTNPDEHDE